MFLDEREEGAPAITYGGGLLPLLGRVPHWLGAAADVVSILVKPRPPRPLVQEGAYQVALH